MAQFGKAAARGSIPQLPRRIRLLIVLAAGALLLLLFRLGCEPLMARSGSQQPLQAPGNSWFINQGFWVELAGSQCFVRPLWEPRHNQLTFDVWTLTIRNRQTNRASAYWTCEVVGKRHALVTLYKPAVRPQPDNPSSQSSTPRRASTPSLEPVIGVTSAATATLSGDYVRIRQPGSGFSRLIEIGWIAADGSSQTLRGFIRDGSYGQTYAVVRRESDGLIVRRWISGESADRFAVPWTIVNSLYTMPTAVVAAIALDEDHPVPNQLARRFDGSDDRIFVYQDGFWRHIPDFGTFQSMEFYWCDVTAADEGFLQRIVLGPPLPSSGAAPRDDYPDCRV